MKLKINVKTPKDQAAKCIETQKKALLGMAQASQILEQKLVNDHEFYWVLNIRSHREMMKTIKKCARGEVLIKKFYRTLISLIDRANKLANKFKKGARWMKRWLVRRIKTKTQGNEELVNAIENMSDEEFKDFLVIHDRVAMQELLAGDLITVEEVK